MKSSKLKVKASRNPARTAGSDLRQGDLPEGAQGRGVQIGRCLDQRAVQRLQPAPGP